MSNKNIKKSKEWKKVIDAAADYGKSAGNVLTYPDSNTSKYVMQFYKELLEESLVELLNSQSGSS